MKLVPLIFLLALSCLAQSPNCLPAPTGLVGWWKGDGDASDSAGTNNGVLMNGAGFAPGEVGQAFSFTGSSFVQVPDAPELDPTNQVSVESWVLLSSYPSNDGIVVLFKNIHNANPEQYHIGVYQTGTNSIFEAAVGIVQSGNFVVYSTTSLQTNTWYHVAMTCDSAELRLYVNGLLESSLAVKGGRLATTTSPLTIGGYGPGFSTLPGRVDEASVYNRALTSDEIQAIYTAGPAGKCFGPSVTVQPQSQVGYWGASAAFSAQARGSAPLDYLWYKDGSPISWATNSSMLLTNLSLDQAGSYYVLVTNAYGSATSSNAQLVINPAGVSLGIYPGLTVQGTPGKTFGIQYTTNVAPNSTWLT